MPNHTDTAAPKRNWRKWAWIVVGAVVAFGVLGAIFGNDGKDKDSTTTAAPTSTVETSVSAEQPPVAEAPAAPVGLTDEAIAADAENYVKVNWGMSRDASWQSFECSPEIEPCWQPYVVGFTFKSGVLRPTLQIDRDGQKALGEKASKNMASFIGFSDEPWAKAIDWVEVRDGAGVHVSQTKVTHR